jgi:hypothetical protein
VDEPSRSFEADLPMLKRFQRIFVRTASLRVLPLCIGVLSSAAAMAQPPSVAPTPPGANANAKPNASESVRVYLMEGSVVSGRLSVESLAVKTAFGTLNVPVEHVVSFTPGLESHPQLRKKIGRQIQQLGSNDAAEREQAQRELLDYGPGLQPLLEPFRNDEDAERKTRIEKILDELDASADSFEATAQTAPSRFIAEDTVETDRFTVVGQISPDSFRVETQFGSLNVALQDIRSVEREGGEKPEVRGHATVDGSNLVQSGLKDTGIRIERGDKLLVTATGQIVMTPFGNNVVSSPDGAGGNVTAYTAGIPGGALLGRIGRNGEEMLVGSQKEFTAKTSGTLFLGVAMSPQFANQGYVFPGTYDVRIRVNPHGR